MGKGEESPGIGTEQYPVALRSFAVHVHGHVGPAQRNVQRRQRLRVDDAVHDPHEGGQGGQSCGRGEHPAVTGERVGERPERRHGREKVTQPKGAQDQQRGSPAVLSEHRGSRPPL
jgi:hypothetical protein